MDYLTLLIVLLSFVAIYLWFRRPDSRLPPCPTTPLPIVGHLFTLKEDPRPQFDQWQKEVGDIFSLYMGSSFVVVISGYDLIKEVLVKKQDAFLDRPKLFMDEATGIPGKGLVLSAGSAWREQRAVTVSILRSFGMGKNIMTEIILEERSHFLQSLRKLKGEPTDLRIITNFTLANITCSLILGHRFEEDDEIFKGLMENIHYIIENQAVNGIINFLPFLCYLPGDLFKTKQAKYHIQQIFDLFVNRFIKLKRQEQQMDSEIQNNFISAYDRVKDQKMKANEETSMEDEQLVKVLWDLFLAGIDTTSSTLLWCLVYSMNFPDIQKKIFLEIEDAIGTERVPSLQDKPTLNYLNAFIMEIQRHVNIAPLSIPRLCSQETCIRGYTIPKGTTIIPNTDSVLRDPKIWGEDVDTFRPERFIGDDGKLKNQEELIVFGFGRRVCLGEGLAKTTLFLYLSSMFQQFQFVSPDPMNPPSFKGIFGLDYIPTAFQVKVVSRKKDI